MTFSHIVYRETMVNVVCFSVNFLQKKKCLRNFNLICNNHCENNPHYVKILLNEFSKYYFP